MTYVIGIRSNDTSAVICDSRVSFGKSEGMNYMLKSGLLFPGCHYAAVGYTKPMRQLVIRLKEYLTGRNTFNGFWDKFVGFVKNYDGFDANHAFQLLLMSRHTGRSTLYLLDSASRSVTVQGDFVTLGSGKEILDPVVEEIWKERHVEIMELLQEQEAPTWFFGYFYCLALMEYVQGVAYDTLNRAGVGGVFHFSYQTTKEEYRQHPAVYVIVSPFVEKKIITYTLYRITFEEMALVVENGAEQSFNILIDAAAWPAVIGLDPNERFDLKERIRRGALDQPFYNFCGVGFGSGDLRGSLCNHLNLGNNDYLFSRNAINSGFVTSLIEGLVTGTLQNELIKRMMV